MAASISSAVATNDEKEIEKILTGIPDPVGTFYRYSLAKSILRKKIIDGR